MEKTTVINCRKENLVKLGYINLEEWLKDPNHIYIGRNMSFYVKGADGSKWANPFSVKKYGREKCLDMYREYIQSMPDLIDSLEELRGKVLACWCCPEPCHGHILIELLEDKIKNDKQV